MAILGFQLVSTLIGVSLLSKLASHFSFTSFFVCSGVFRCLLPTDKEILDSAGLTKIKQKGKKHRNGPPGTGSSPGNSQIEAFHFPRATPIKLRQAQVRLFDIASLPLYSELVWLLDFSVCAFAVLFVNEVVGAFRQSRENQSSPGNYSSILSISMQNFFSPSCINLSFVWCFFLVWFSFSGLFSIFCVYFHTLVNSSPEQQQLNPVTTQTSKTVFSECVIPVLVTILTFFVIAMFSFSMDARFFDLKVYPAYMNLTLNSTLSSFSETGSSFAISWGMFQVCLALIAALIGMLFSSPGLQFGRVYLQVIRNSHSVVRQLLFHLNFIAPFFTLLLWVLPLISPLPNSFFRFADSHSGTLGPTGTSLIILISKVFSPDCIGSLRLLATLFMVSLRLLMTKHHLQAYLETAQARLDKLTREPGRISNVEVQRLVASVFHCFNFAALQYLAPAILMFGLLLSYKVTTSTPWLPLFDSTLPTGVAEVKNHSLESLLSIFTGQDWESVFTAPWFAAMRQTREAFGELFESLRTKAGNVCHGVFGFLLWWCLAAWQLVTVAGMAYYRFLD